MRRQLPRQQERRFNGMEIAHRWYRPFGATRSPTVSSTSNRGLSEHLQPRRRHWRKVSPSLLLLLELIWNGVTVVSCRQRDVAFLVATSNPRIVRRRLALLSEEHHEAMTKTPVVSPKGNDNDDGNDRSSDFLYGTLGDIMSEQPSPRLKPSSSAEILHDVVANRATTAVEEDEEDTKTNVKGDNKTIESRHADFPEWMIRDDVASLAAVATARTFSEGSFQGLVTTAHPGGTLQSRFNFDMSPLDRIALTANGNLQRIFSSYYDAPVHVHVDRCVLRPQLPLLWEARRNGKHDWRNGSRHNHSHNKKSNSDSNALFPSDVDNNTGHSSNSLPKPPAVWDRTVHLSVHGQTLCVANSVITVHSSDCIQLVHSGAVGIGQLFRYLDQLPRFELQQAGRRSSGELWRRYTLESPQVSCMIEEEFTPNVWKIGMNPPHFYSNNNGVMKPN